MNFDEKIECNSPENIFICLELYYDETIEHKRAKLLLGNEFNRLLDSGLILMIEKTLNELEEAGCPVNLKDPHLNEVKEVLAETAKNVAKKISEEVHGRPLSLLVDGTTKRRRSILGVSVQYIINEKHTTRSIGMILLKQSHTGEHLAKIICDLLLQFNIKPQQVISITTDNGSNVVKMVRDLSSHMAAVEKNSPCDETMNPETAFCDDDIEQYLEMVPECTEDEATVHCLSLTMKMMRLVEIRFYSKPSLQMFKLIQV